MTLSHDRQSEIMSWLTRAITRDDALCRYSQVDAEVQSTLGIDMGFVKAFVRLIDGNLSTGR